MLTAIPDLGFEIRGDVVDLEQDAGCGEKVCVSLHRTQVALLAGELGIVRAPHDGEAQRAIETLQRRLRVLHRRIVFLDDYLHGCSDRKHANLDYECAFSNATRDVADEFVADIDPSPAREADTMRADDDETPA